MPSRRRKLLESWLSRPVRPRRRPLGPRFFRPAFESLEDRRVLAADFPEFVDPHPNPGNQFGHSVVALSTGNVVVTSPYDDAGGANSGAVYLFNGATGELISTLLGGSPDDQIGINGVVPLKNGNYVILSPWWDSGQAADAGAVTFGNGSTGVSGFVSPVNSLVGSAPGDVVGRQSLSAFPGSALTDVITVLENGNYVVHMSWWNLNSGDISATGAIAFGDGTNGTTGVVSPTNSLVGTGFDTSSTVVALANGNYVVANSEWDMGKGAVTFGNGTSGIAGTISAATSLVGSKVGDYVGNRVVALSNGNYVVASPNWDHGGIVDAGAATFGNGTSGIVGTISAANSLVGTSSSDFVGEHVVALTNGNYVVASPRWDNGSTANAGAVTFAGGNAGISGAISPTNSLIGNNTDSYVGSRSVTPLTNGNYVVRSPDWSSQRGAVTFGDGVHGITGIVSATNSLVGSKVGDGIGNAGVTALTNGNYVVASPGWDNGILANVGAVTLGSGTSGVVGSVSAANSLVGTASNDAVGSRGVTPLTTGNYVVSSPSWRGGLVSSFAQPLGAVTFGSGTSGTTGSVSTANSLVGSKPGDSLGSGQVSALAQGAYVVIEPSWDNGTTINVGAVTFGNATSGVTGSISSANSLIGIKPNDSVGSGGVATLSNGNYAVASPGWDNLDTLDAGAVTFGQGTSGITGFITGTNSAVGTQASSDLQSIVVDDVHGNFFARFLGEGGGRIRVGSQFDGFAPPPSVSFSISSVSGSETARTVITLTATADSPVRNDQTLDVVVNGVGIQPSDFHLSDTKITIPHGSTTGSITFTVADDLLNEGDEVATIALAHPTTGITLGTSVSSSLTITDDDTSGTSNYTLPAPGIWRLVLDGTALEIRDSEDRLVAGRAGGMAGIEIRGTADGEKLIVDLSGGNPIPSGGLTFHASGGADGIIVAGGSANDAIHYMPDGGSSGNGEIAIDMGSGPRAIDFTGMDAIDVRGPASAALILAGPQSVLHLTESMDFLSGGNHPAVKVSGTSGGVDIVPVAFFGNESLVVDTSPGDSADIILLGEMNDGHGIAHLSIDTGEGADAIRLAGDVAVSGTLTLATAGDIRNEGTGGRVTAPQVQFLSAMGTGTEGSPIRMEVQRLEAYGGTGGVFVSAL